MRERLPKRKRAGLGDGWVDDIYAPPTDRQMEIIRHLTRKFGLPMRHPQTIAKAATIIVGLKNRAPRPKGPRNPYVPPEDRPTEYQKSLIVRLRRERGIRATKWPEPCTKAEASAQIDELRALPLTTKQRAKLKAKRLKTKGPNAVTVRYVDPATLR